jgi:small subunit ribosomal protein S2
MKALLEAGVHFGHQTRRWNPQMKRYIFTQRNGIHIIDLQQTLGMVNEAYRAMVQVAADGGKVLFVGTKRQAQEVIQSEADRCGMWYVNQRWLGGTLTNFQTIRSRINYMLELQQKRDQGYFRVLPKKEALKLRDTLARLEKYFLGMRDMGDLPKALFVIDIGKEDICIAEARRMGLEIFAIVDTDCDPNKVGHIIPGNDDAVRSIRLITSRMATAVLEGIAQREAMLLAEREALEVEELPEDDEITSSSQEVLGLDAHVDLEDMALLEAQLLSAGQSSGQGLEIPTPEMPAGETAPRRRVRQRQPASSEQGSEEASTGQQTGEARRRATPSRMEEADSGDFLAEDDDPAAGSR